MREKSVCSMSYLFLCKSYQTIQIAFLWIILGSIMLNGLENLSNSIIIFNILRLKDFFCFILKTMKIVLKIGTVELELIFKHFSFPIIFCELFVSRAVFIFLIFFFVQNFFLISICSSLILLKQLCYHCYYLNISYFSNFNEAYSILK